MYQLHVSILILKCVILNALWFKMKRLISLRHVTDNKDFLSIFMIKFRVSVWKTSFVCFHGQIQQFLTCVQFFFFFFLMLFCTKLIVIDHFTFQHIDNSLLRLNLIISVHNLQLEHLCFFLSFRHFWPCVANLRLFLIYFIIKLGITLLTIKNELLIKFKFLLLLVSFFDK